MTTNQIIQQIKDMEARIKFYKAEIKLLGGINGKWIRANDWKRISRNPT